MKLAYSILEINSLNFSEYFSQLSFDAIHLDLMDGHAVPNLGVPPWIIPAIREKTDVPIQAHLMTNPTELFVDLVCKYAPEIVFIHPYWCYSVAMVAKKLRNYGTKVGVVWNNDGAEEYFDLADELLFMTVEPGRSGQKLINERLQKIRTLADNKPFWLDGGINVDNFDLIVQLKPNGIIAGKGIFDLQQFFKK